MMYCRTAWQRLAPLASKTLSPLSRNAVPTRQMSFGLPASGTNIAYMMLGGGSLTVALIYAYKTINSDSTRYNDRIAPIDARPKRVAVAVAEASPEAASAVETEAVERSTIAETTVAEPIIEVVAAELTPAAAEASASEAFVASEEAPAELLVAAAVEAEESIVEAVAPAIEEPATPLVEDVATEAPVAETAAFHMSDLQSTVKIIAGSTAEIAAASVGDEHLVAAVRLTEEKSSVETLNELEVADVKAEVLAEASVTEEAKTEGELEEQPSTPAVEKVTVEAAAVDNVESEADSPVEVEVSIEVSASVAGAFEELVVIDMEEENTLCHEPVDTEIEHVDITMPPAALEKALQTTTQASQEIVTQTMDDVEEAKPAEVAEEAVESENIMMAMPQA
ncbi:fibrous sheath CABYR-binding protein-like [Myxocyprinus asiaticus]|uniref:fibrous sheath CABYR-binding protein-like n=1 Tax=Myxocyprinus asiaticus TaxID=70543 RepID=UPI002221EF4D|nr:fibrous sheath CABYR-binding protein-like [Myxocyprinus asiaticus]